MPDSGNNEATASANSTAYLRRDEWCDASGGCDEVQSNGVLYLSSRFEVDPEGCCRLFPSLMSSPAVTCPTITRARHHPCQGQDVACFSHVVGRGIHAPLVFSTAAVYSHHLHPHYGFCYPRTINRVSRSCTPHSLLDPHGLCECLVQWRPFCAEAFINAQAWV